MCCAAREPPREPLPARPARSSSPTTRRRRARSCRAGPSRRRRHPGPYRGQPRTAGLPGRARQDDRLLEHAVDRARGNFPRRQRPHPVRHRGVDVARAYVAEARRVTVPRGLETTGEHARERAPLLRGGVRAQDRERLAPLRERARFHEFPEVVGHDRGGDAQVRPIDVRLEVRRPGFFPELCATDGGEDEGIRVTTRGDTRGNCGAIVAHDECALHFRVGRVEDLRRFVLRRSLRRRLRRRFPPRGDELGCLWDRFRGRGRGRLLR
eukprot:30497-Pelagococcus_subviridis.AAC.23